MFQKLGDRSEWDAAIAAAGGKEEEGSRSEGRRRSLLLVLVYLWWRMTGMFHCTYQNMHVTSPGFLLPEASAATARSLILTLSVFCGFFDML